MEFDDALAAVLDLIGRPVDVQIFDVSEMPRPVVTLPGVIRAGHPADARTAGADEATVVMLEIGGDAAAVCLDRKEFRGGTVHDGGAVSLRVGAVRLQISPRDGE